MANTAGLLIGCHRDSIHPTLWMLQIKRQRHSNIAKIISCFTMFMVRCNVDMYIWIYYRNLNINTTDFWTEARISWEMLIREIYTHKMIQDIYPLKRQQIIWPFQDLASQYKNAGNTIHSATIKPTLNNPFLWHS